MYLHFGKRQYYIAQTPDVPYAYSYSAQELERSLRALLCGQTLKAIYFGLCGYLESLHSGKNLIDLSYMGGSLIVVFEKTVIQFMIHGLGMIEYRFFPVWELHLRKVIDYPPDDLVRSDRYFYNALDHEVSYRFADSAAFDVRVKGIDCWPFPQPDFDETIAQKAADRNDLPTEIDLLTETCTICFAADSIEYSYVLFEPPAGKNVQP